MMTHPTVSPGCLIVGLTHRSDRPIVLYWVWSVDERPSDIYVHGRAWCCRMCKTLGGLPCDLTVEWGWWGVDFLEALGMERKPFDAIAT